MVNEYSMTFKVICKMSAGYFDYLTCIRNRFDNVGLHNYIITITGRGEIARHIDISDNHGNADVMNIIALK